MRTGRCVAFARLRARDMHFYIDVALLDFRLNAHARCARAFSFLRLQTLAALRLRFVAAAYARATLACVSPNLTCLLDWLPPPAIVFSAAHSTPLYLFRIACRFRFSRAAGWNNTRFILHALPLPHCPVRRALPPLDCVPDAAIATPSAHCTACCACHYCAF